LPKALVQKRAVRIVKAHQGGAGCVLAWEGQRSENGGDRFFHRESFIHSEGKDSTFEIHCGRKMES